ncbi:MAG: SsrA-binding protein [Ignavibacteriales bacterium CG_4_9_14_3_um_filter_34_10]|nr:MAG: SsrA-binding protein [Ignavibacteriales bacterium CG_4_9_14_3_um_filter_34_10]
MKDNKSQKNITVNRKAEHDYFVSQRIEAGISLVGTEVKSLRLGKANLTDAYAMIIENEVWLVNAHISKFDQGSFNNHEPLRKRRLLLKRSEIRKLKFKLQEKGFTLIPLRFYFKENKIKVELGLAKGKKLYDKREAIAKKDLKRDLERKLN